MSAQAWLFSLGPAATSGSSFMTCIHMPKRGFDYRYVPLLRRVAMCAAAKCARSPAARDALTDLVLKEAPLAVVKALSVAAAHGLSPRCWAPAPPRDRVPRLDADMDTDGLRQWFVDRHEPCVLAGWACGGRPFAAAARARAGQESEIPNFKGSFLGRFPLVSADFWTSDHLLERSRSVDAFSGTRARGTLTLKRR